MLEENGYRWSPNEAETDDEEEEEDGGEWVDEGDWVQDEEEDFTAVKVSCWKSQMRPHYSASWQTSPHIVMQAGRAGSGLVLTSGTLVGGGRASRKGTGGNGKWQKTVML